MSKFSSVPFALLFLLSMQGWAANFQIQGSTIKDPDGIPFIPVGANISVDNFYGWNPFLAQNNAVSSFTKSWRFNIARANLVIGESKWDGVVLGTGWSTDSSRSRIRIDAVVDSLTPKKAVVILEVHDWLGRYPSLASDYLAIRNFWSWAAIRYKANPYVWFNLWNEPGWESPVSPDYFSVNQKLIRLIRDTLQVENVIVVDGAAYGQDSYSWNDDSVWEGNSGILHYGKQLSKGFQNIVFSVHLYDQWGPNDTGFVRVNKFRDYLQRVKDSSLAILVGEVGSTSATRFIGTTQMAYEIGLKEFGVGMLAWHWDPGDGFRLTDGINQYAGYHINDESNPTNLTPWMGQWFWRATHLDGYGINGFRTPVIKKAETPQQVTVQNRTIDILGRERHLSRHLRSKWRTFF